MKISSKRRHHLSVCRLLLSGPALGAAVALAACSSSSSSSSSGSAAGTPAA